MTESAYARSAAFYDAIYGRKPYEAESEQIHAVVQRHLRTGGSTLLDVGCGTGGHLAHLRRHYRCDGVDLDAGLLRIARERFPDSRFEEGDMAEFHLDRRYDIVACLFSAIGYVRTEAKLRRTLANFARHLRPGGVVVVEPWLAPGVFIPGTVRMDTSDTPEMKVARVTHSAMRGELSVLSFHFLVGRGEGVQQWEEHHELGLFTREQTMDAFRAAGLDVVEHDPHGLTGRGLYVARLPD